MATALGDDLLPTEQRRSTPDATTALTGLVVLLIAVPSQLVFAPLGAAGSPAQLLGLVLLVAWMAYRIIGPAIDLRPAYWMRFAVALFVVVPPPRPPPAPGLTVAALAPAAC